MTDEHVRYAAFPGRWCPPHRGHMRLIEQKLGRGIPCLLLVRDSPDPIPSEVRAEMLRELYAGEPVKVRVIPDIESINWGRGVGWEPIEHDLSDDVEAVSATDVREQVRAGTTGWKAAVPDVLHEKVRKALG